MLKGIRWIFLTVWALFIAHMLFFSPPFDDGSTDLILDMILDPGSVDPLVLSAFNLLGVWPFVYGSFLLFDEREKLRNPWIFFAASFFSGAFAVLPYLAIRKWDNTYIEGSRIERVLGSRWMAAILLLISIGLVVYGISLGDPGEYRDLFRSNQLVSVMTVDLVILTFSAVPLMYHDIRRRRGEVPLGMFVFLAMLPLFGPLLYLIMRRIRS